LWESLAPYREGQGFELNCGKPKEFALFGFDVGGELGEAIAASFGDFERMFYEF